MTIADAPFDDPTDNADLVIRTSDNVDFYVLSALLSLKSPSSFFRHVLKNSQHTEEKDGFPVLEVMEDSGTFRTILLLCYPDDAPQIKSVEQIGAVKTALDKYCMDHAQERFMQMVTASSLMKEHALRIFVLALARGWRVLGEIAAKSTFTNPLDEPEAELEELGCINALQYVQLRNYRRECRRVIRDMLNAAPWLEDKASQLLFPYELSGLFKKMCRWCGAGSGEWIEPVFYTHPWFKDYLKTVKAEMLLRPCTATALDDLIIANAVTKSISECSSEEWKKIALSQVRLCGKFLMEEIDRQISQVPLNIDWTK
ncbi:hypothetical protein IW261DRAFT_1427831 [Armillaria novae-zelandiae]|uniref:BTB domain-containing protein n=1 Tax=Armillaria novae-zelandiae TaxID=153914 RepID=A0AA39TYT0_9AGAR|nr:hypothetical protein IW261DRAFT_1427831 [Armillaria novae-zelandiae]